MESSLFGAVASYGTHVTHLHTGPHTSIKSEIRVWLCVCVCQGVSVAYMCETYATIWEKGSEAIPWALEECTGRGCRVRTPFVVVRDEDSGERVEGGVLEAYHRAPSLGFRRRPLGQCYDLEKPRGQGRTNKPSLSISHHPSITKSLTLIVPQLSK